MSKLNQAQQEIIGKIVGVALSEGVTVTFSNEKKVIMPGEGEDLGCSGFFHNDLKLLSVATDKPTDDWLSVLIHEYHHLLQWMEDKEDFESCDDESFWSWIEYIVELEDDCVKKKAESIMFYEYDAERRTAKLIQDNPGLDIDLNEYIRRANAYIYLYPMIVKHRKWCTKAPPYKVPELMELVPNHFLELEEYWNVSEEIEEAIVNGCFIGDKE